MNHFFRGAWLAGLVTVLGIVSCSGTAPTSGKVVVAASFDAMAELTRAVGGEKVEVTTFVPAGTEPHDFEPTARDLEGLGKAAVFVYNGLGMEAWADKVVKTTSNKVLVVVNASTGASPIVNTEEEEIAEHGPNDPHLWLSLSGAGLQAQNIAAALTKVDAANAAFYAKNLSDLVQQLTALQDEYVAKFQSVKKKAVVTGHAAFAYFCRDFGLEQNSVENVFAEGEPTAKALANLVDYCRQNQVTTIFAEDMVSPEVSKALAEEVGAKVVVIDTLEGPDEGKTYLARMQENLEKVFAALSQ